MSLTSLQFIVLDSWRWYLCVYYQIWIKSVVFAYAHFATPLNGWLDTIWIPEPTQKVPHLYRFLLDNICHCQYTRLYIVHFILYMFIWMLMYMSVSVRICSHVHVDQQTQQKQQQQISSTTTFSLFKFSISCLSPSACKRLIFRLLVSASYPPD